MSFERSGNFRVSDPPNLPLAGIVVLDFGQVFQGPYATLLMAKAGFMVPTG
jgi:crotonobetainyl-CoA:carnitine CoA-transferase CaiB-like acyl-CoA transferase